jgi:predicted phosphodiesterase
MTESVLEAIAKGQDGRKSRPVNYIEYAHDGSFHLWPFSDLHFGAPEFNDSLFFETLERTWEDPEAVLILNGDLIEASTRTSVGSGVYEQKVAAQEQLEWVVDTFKPFADQGRILGVTNGNHEDRITKATGVDVTRTYAQMLGVPYFQHGGHFKLRAGDQNYHAYFTHGSSSARLPHTKIRQTLDLARFIDADLYGMGHVHELQAHTQEYRRINNRNGAVEIVPKLFVLTGHYLNYENSYAQMMSMIPSRQGTPKITLRDTERDLRVTL